MGRSFPPMHFLLRASAIILVCAPQETDTKSFKPRGGFSLTSSGICWGAKRLCELNQWIRNGGCIQARDGLQEATEYYEFKEMKPRTTAPVSPYLQSLCRLLLLDLRRGSASRSESSSFPILQNNYQPPVSPETATRAMVLQGLPCLIDLDKDSDIQSPDRGNSHVTGSTLCSISS